ncbi:hypothetical protein Ssi02_59080 [Sinosporangium siamense]|uniref:Uncharacterized protein n=1 Tax=Sinosporangium siamense TaxID=1367973 RepID=A0A919RKV0_9ACTN|nr:hypothetical protein Ssi02_59080 [Sinosporangium siamense]
MLGIGGLAVGGLTVLAIGSLAISGLAVLGLGVLGLAVRSLSVGRLSIGSLAVRRLTVRRRRLLIGDRLRTRWRRITGLTAISLPAVTLRTVVRPAGVLPAVARLTLALLTVALLPEAGCRISGVLPIGGLRPGGRLRALAMPTLNLRRISRLAICGRLPVSGSAPLGPGLTITRLPITLVTVNPLAVSTGAGHTVVLRVTPLRSVSSVAGCRLTGTCAWAGLPGDGLPITLGAISARVSALWPGRLLTVAGLTTGVLACGTRRAPVGGRDRRLIVAVRHAAALT